ncbi:MAG: hypothetical protein U0075_26480, partial [Thermomicrobiales bacterium]
VLVNAGGAVMLQQDDATPDRLLEACLAILEDPGRRQQMSDAARSVAQPEAASKLADLVLELAAR